MAHQQAPQRTLVRYSGHVGSGRRARERGSFAVMGTMWLLIALVVLGTVDIGHQFFERRDLQRIADMSAQAAVQTMDSSCGQAPSTALAVARANGLGASAVSATLPSVASPPLPASGTNDAIAVQCGRWDTAAAPASPVQGTSPYFTPYTSSGSPMQLNAAWVQVSRSVPYFFLGPTRTITAMSTARESQIDVFSVGATIASVNPTWLNATLTALLGTPTNIGLTLGNYQALASANITLGGLATALGVGTPSALATTSIGLNTLLGDLNTYVGALQAGSGGSSGYVANLQAVGGTGGLLSSLSAVAPSTTINLGQVLNAGLGVPNAAASAQVSVLDLLTTSLMLANAGHAISLGSSVTLPLGSGSPFQAANIQLQVLNPPSIAVGEAGLTSAGTWRTQATSAVIGLYLDVSVPSPTNIPGLSGLLGGLLGALGLGSLSISNIDLPIYLLVGGPAMAGLAATSCDSNTSGYTATNAGSSTATMVVKPGLAQLCLGSKLSGSLNLSNVGTCPGNPTPSNPVTVPILKVTATNLLGLLSQTVSASATITGPLLQIGGGAVATAPYTGAVPSNYGTVTAATTPYSFCVAPGNSTPVSCGSNWTAPAVNGNSTASWTTYANNLGNQAGQAVTNMGLSSVNLNVLGITVTLPNMTSILGQILTPVLTALDSVLTPLLSLLGVQIGEATVHQISMSCNAPQIVY